MTKILVDEFPVWKSDCPFRTYEGDCKLGDFEYTCTVFEYDDFADVTRVYKDRCDYLKEVEE